VEASTGVVSNILPPDLVEVLRCESPDGIVKMKEYVVAAINKEVDIIGLSKEQQSQLVEKLVDVLIDEYVAGTEAEYVLLGNDIDKQEDYLLATKARLQREQTLSRLRCEREKKNLALRLEIVEQRIKFVRQRRPFFRRIFRGIGRRR
jgi:hypothetical protein